MYLMAKHQSKRHGGGKDLQEPTEVQPTMVKALWVQKMDFQSPGWLGTRWKTCIRFQQRKHPGDGVGGKVPGIK